MKINGYVLKTELQNANSGFSKWGFATKDSKEYFIKELIHPVYPVDREVLTEEQFENRRSYCEEYEEKSRRFFGQVNKASRGNLVRIIEFFRCGGKYYLITEKVDGKTVPMYKVAELDEKKKLLLFKTVAQGFCDLHSVGIVHFDVKPANILLKQTKTGNLTAKLIDFDSGFFKGEKLETDDLGGDLTYLAPETFLAICGQNTTVDEKADIFGMGLVLHQYYCGVLPQYDKNEYEYPYEAALDSVLKPEYSMMPEEIGDIIASMICADPSKRPSARDIVEKLSALMNIREEYDDIKCIAIRFGGQFGKFISLSDGMIRYRNTIDYPDKVNTKNIPEDYFALQQTDISREQFDSIVKEIYDSGVMDIVTPCANKDAESQMTEAHETLAIVYRDDVTYEYAVSKKPHTCFVKALEILLKYCAFPEFNDDWKAENISIEQDERLKGTGMEEERYREENETTPIAKNEGWFKRAGDL